MLPPEEDYGVLCPPELVRNLPMESFLREQLTLNKGCPLCRTAEHEEFSLFAALLGDITRDAHHPLLTSDPLCNRHAMFFARVGSADSTASLCRPWLRRQLTLDHDQWLKPSAYCPACRLLRTRQKEWLFVMENLLEKADHHDAYAQGHGLCFPHYRAALERFTSAAAVDLLKQTCSVQIERLLPQLDQVIERGPMKVDRQVKASPRYALEKLYGCAGLTDYLLLTDADTNPQGAKEVMGSGR